MEQHLQPTWNLKILTHHWLLLCCGFCRWITAFSTERLCDLIKYYWAMDCIFRFATTSFTMLDSWHVAKEIPSIRTIISRSKSLNSQGYRTSLFLFKFSCIYFYNSAAFLPMRFKPTRGNFNQPWVCFMHCNALVSGLERQLQLNIYVLSVHREATEMQIVNKMAREHHFYQTSSCHLGTHL